MKNKIISAFLVTGLLIPNVFANTFSPEVKYNTFNIKLYKAKCKIHWDDETSQYCHYSVNSSEFKKRLEVVNWYNDFDMLMRQKMLNEVLYDYNPKNDLSDIIKVDENKWKNNALRILSEYSNSYNSVGHLLVSNKNYTEDLFKEMVLKKSLRMFKVLEVNYVVWFNTLDIKRQGLIADGYLEDNASNEYVYLGNIDEIYSLLKKHRFEDYHPGDVRDIKNVFYPNVKKYFELKKQWQSFYADYKLFNDQDFKDLGYTQKEVEKFHAWEYINSYDNKTDFDFTIEQTIGTSNLWESETIIVEVPKEETKLEIYEKLWKMDYDKDYAVIYAIVDKYMKKQKRKWKTDTDIQRQITKLLEKVDDIIITYENSYNTATTVEKKNKFKKFVWIFLVFEDVLKKYSYELKK